MWVFINYYKNKGWVNNELGIMIHVLYTYCYPFVGMPSICALKMLALIE